MRTGLLQWDLIWLDVDKNLEIIEKYLRRNQNSFDVLILPEMFATGFVLDTSRLEKSWQEKITTSLTELCRKHHIHIMGSIPYFKNNQWFNSFCVWSNQGLIHQYDKIHLFALAGENKQYAPGNSPGIFTNNHWKIAPFVCYDLRFPAISAFDKFPQLFVFVANWPSLRIQHWECLLRARAIENQAYVIGVNRLGKDENGYEYPGRSMVFDFSGQLLIDMETNPGIQVVSLDLIALINYRNKYPFLKDRVRF